jgi:polyhydroxybutyrate depolymerase
VSQLPPDVTIRRWHSDTPSSDVVFYRIAGAGHTWPDARRRLPRILLGKMSRTIDGSRVIWAFLAAHSRVSRT